MPRISHQTNLVICMCYNTISLHHFHLMLLLSLSLGYFVLFLCVHTRLWGDKREWCLMMNSNLIANLFSMWMPSCVSSYRQSFDIFAKREQCKRRSFFFTFSWQIDNVFLLASSMLYLYFFCHLYHSAMLFLWQKNENIQLCTHIFNGMATMIWKVSQWGMCVFCLFN